MQTYVFTVAVTGPAGPDVEVQVQDYVEELRNRLIDDDGHTETIDVMVTDGVRVTG